MKRTLIIALLLILSAATAYAKEGVIFARFHKGQSDLYFVGLDGKGLTEVFLAYADDGRVIFSKRAPQHSDLYSIRIGEKEPTPLAVSPDIEDFLSLTPDKTRLVFHRFVKRLPNIYAVDVDGGNMSALAKGVLHNTFHALARDRVIYARKGKEGEKLYSVRLDGKDTRVISDIPGDSYFEMLSHDGRVLFSTESPEGTPGALYIVDPDGAGQAVIADGPAYAWTKSMTADNRLGYFVETGKNTRNLYFVDLDKEGLKSVPLTSGPGAKMFQAFTDDDRIVYSATTAKKENNLFTVKTDGTGRKALSKGPGFKRFRTLAPGNRVIYTTDIDGKKDLYAVKTDGTGLVALAATPDDEGYRWLSQEGKVLFVRFVDGKHWDLHSVSLDGTGLVTIGRTGKNELLARIAEDGRIVFTRQAGYRNSDIYIANPDGRNVIALAKTDDDERFVEFAPGGRLIFMRIAEPGEEEKKKPEKLRRKQGDLYIVNLDGKNLTPLATSLDPEKFMFLIEEEKAEGEEKRK
jgi:Tol biopolymer transport system component